MNVETMSMDRYEARKLYIEYRRSVRAHRDERRRQAEAEANAVHARRTQIEREENELRAAYLAMSQGQTVLRLTSVIAAAGVDANSRPKLAVARSHWDWCRLRTSSYGGATNLEFCSQELTDVLRIPLPSGWRYTSGRALVPPVPPRFRPVDVENYYTLWEAEWQPEPPRDPLLLRKISETLFVVVAQWDLTPIERAVLEGRFA